MFQKRTVTCACGVEFTTRSPNKTRCDKCQRKHHREMAHVSYEKRKAELASMPKEEREMMKGRRIEEKATMLNLPCPWWEGRLPDSVTRNQLWR